MKYFALCICFLLVFTVGCTAKLSESAEERLIYGGVQTAPEPIEELPVGMFSYVEDSGIYKVGAPGVNPHAFVNTDEVILEDTDAVIERAERECTVEYDTVTVWHDVDTGVYKALFWTFNAVGGGQTVYMNDKGVTLLTVYGE